MEYVCFRLCSTVATDQANRVDKRFIKPVEIERWVVVIYEQQRRFGENAAQDMINGLISSCKEVGGSYIYFSYVAFYSNILQVSGSTIETLLSNGKMDKVALLTYVSQYNFHRKIYHSTSLFISNCALQEPSVLPE
jgi:hypothetical protein